MTSGEGQRGASDDRDPHVVHTITRALRAQRAQSRTAPLQDVDLFRQPQPRLLPLVSLLLQREKHHPLPDHIPLGRWTALTSAGALSVCSIFIASRTTRGSPADGLARTRENAHILPGIGETTLARPLLCPAPPRGCLAWPTSLTWSRTIPFDERPSERHSPRRRPCRRLRLQERRAAHVAPTTEAELRFLTPARRGLPPPTSSSVSPTRRCASPSWRPAASHLKKEHAGEWRRELHRPHARGPYQPEAAAGWRGRRPPHSPPPASNGYAAQGELGRSPIEEAARASAWEDSQ